LAISRLAWMLLDVMITATTDVLNGIEFVSRDVE
jgi:hypothetical protein